MEGKAEKQQIICVFFTGISILWWIFCYVIGIGHIRIWGSFCLQYIWEFSLGFIVAEAFYKGKTYRIKNHCLLLCAIVGIALQAGLALFSDALKVFNDIPAFIGYTSLALLFANIPVVKKLCIQLSVFSYEYFLIHILIFTTIFHFANPQGLLTECLWGCISILVALTAAFYYNVLMKQNWRKGYGKINL